MREPSHRSELILPDGRCVLLSETYPIAKFRTRLYCKYCYTTHADWHLMAKEDYGKDNRNTIILCGKCEHTSMVMLIENVNESKRALRVIRDEPPRDCGPFGIIGFNKETGYVEVLSPSKREA